VVLSWLDYLFGLVFNKHVVCVCMKSRLGRNARFCAIRYGISASDIGRYRLNRTCFADKFASSLTTGFMDRACFAYEVIAIRQDRLTMMHHDFV